MPTIKGWDVPLGMKVCAHCNGYGSSLKDPPGVDTCTVCKGTGLVPATKGKE